MRRFHNENKLPFRNIAGRQLVSMPGRKQQGEAPTTA